METVGHTVKSNVENLVRQAAQWMWQGHRGKGWQENAWKRDLRKYVIISVNIIIIIAAVAVFLPSVLWHCWLGDRKVIWRVKTEHWCVCGSGVTAALHVFQFWLALSPPPSSLAPLNPEWFDILVAAYPGCRGIRTVNDNVYSCSCFWCFCCIFTAKSDRLANVTS